MWIRNKETGSAEFVADLTRVFDLIDTDMAEAIDELPERPAEPVSAPGATAETVASIRQEVAKLMPVEIRDGAKIHDPRPAKKPKRG